MTKISSIYLSELSNSEKLQICGDLFSAKNWGMQEIKAQLPSGEVFSIAVSQLKELQDSVETMFG